MGEGKAGVAAALESLGATAEPAELGEVEQLELLPALDVLDAGGNLPPRAPIGQAAAAPRGPGRPPGARNRSTEQWRQYLLQRYGSPLEALLRLAAADTGQLAERNGLKRGEALAMQRQAMEAALPYLHQRLPQAVEISGEGAVLNLVVSQEVYNQVARPADPGAVVLEGTIEQNQGDGGDADG